MEPTKRKIQEASIYCGVSQEIILKYINESWVHPSLDDVLDNEDLARIVLIHDLLDELGVNEEAVPIILNLLDQLNRMHLELKRFSQEPS